MAYRNYSKVIDQIIMEGPIFTILRLWSDNNAIFHRWGDNWEPRRSVPSAIIPNIHLPSDKILQKVPHSSYEWLSSHQSWQQQPLRQQKCKYLYDSNRYDMGWRWSKEWWLWLMRWGGWAIGGGKRINFDIEWRGMYRRLIRLLIRREEGSYRCEESPNYESISLI